MQPTTNISFQQLLDAIKQLSPKEKIQLLEALHEECTDIPAEHQALVIGRVKQARKNPENLLDWDSVAKNL